MGELTVEVGLAQLADAASQVRNAARRLAQLARIRERQPIRRQVYAAGLVVAGTALVLDLGTPSQGRFWTIRSLAISDAQAVNTAVTGVSSVDWYSGKLAGGGLPATSAWQWHQAAAPLLSPFTSEVIHVEPQDHLICVVIGATTAGQQLLAKAEVWDQETVTFDVVQST